MNVPGLAPYPYGLVMFDPLTRSQACDDPVLFVGSVGGDEEADVTYIANPGRCGPVGMVIEKRGGTKKYSAATNPATTARSTGRSPPTQEATATAAKNVAYGMWSPKSGSRNQRTTTAAVTAASATTY